MELCLLWEAQDVLKALIGDIHVFYKCTKILGGEDEELEYPFCELYFDNYDTCIIKFDKNGKVVYYEYLVYTKR